MSNCPFSEPCRLVFLQYNPSDYLLKILIVGNSGVGKSSILLRYTDDIFNNMYITTIGVDFKIKGIEFDNKKTKLQLWDTAGQERFRKLNSSYYKGAAGVMLVYDISEEESFFSLENWIQEIDKNASKGVKRFLIGNKNDLENKRQVSSDQGKEFAKKHGLSFLETSAKTAFNVEEAFISLTKEIMIFFNQKEKTFEKKSLVKKEKSLELNKKKEFSKINRKEYDKLMLDAANILVKNEL